MAAVTRPELSPGLNAWLDIKVLKECSGVLTNAKVSPGVIHGVDRNGPFLILEVDASSEECLCVPLYTHDGVDRMPINQKDKSGPGRGWINRDSYFSRVEFWKIPSDCFLAASHIEMNAVGSRQRYGANNTSVLAAIIVYKDASEADYLPIQPTPPLENNATT